MMQGESLADWQPGRPRTDFPLASSQRKYLALLTAKGPLTASSLILPANNQHIGVRLNDVVWCSLQDSDSDRQLHKVIYVNNFSDACACNASSMIRSKVPFSGSVSSSSSSSPFFSSSSRGVPPLSSLRQHCNHPRVALLGYICATSA